MNALVPVSAVKNGYRFDYIDNARADLETRLHIERRLDRDVRADASWNAFFGDYPVSAFALTHFKLGGDRLTTSRKATMLIAEISEGIYVLGPPVLASDAPATYVRAMRCQVAHALANLGATIIIAVMAPGRIDDDLFLRKSGRFFEDHAIDQALMDAAGAAFMHVHLDMPERGLLVARYDIARAYQPVRSPPPPSSAGIRLERFGFRGRVRAPGNVIDGEGYADWARKD
ncbi:hypothetical protein [Vitreimonas flagellata]|uniref:hypothetical protein n=1 Tax=Vitreimonas flagellata TaxID=2560861 RepID=UPI001075152E|nr:hypothetical protein [Vitreimonas flagellata]